MESESCRSDEEHENRRGEQYCSSRFFYANGEWFFSTREGAQIGPYANKFEAEAGAERHIEHMKSAQNEGVEHAVGLAKEGTWQLNHFS